MLLICAVKDFELISSVSTGGGSGGGVTVDSIYPVGSIYMSVNPTSPGILIGGTWERIQDKFLLAAGTTYSAGASGGAATVTLTEEQLPSVSGTFDIRHWGPGDMIGNCSGKFSSSSNSGAQMTGTTPNSTTEAGQRITYKFGSGSAHENMPPYLAVYVWQRTA